MSHRGKSEYNYGPRGGFYQNKRWTEKELGKVEVTICPDCGSDDLYYLGETFKGNYGRVHHRCEQCQYVWSESPKSV